MKKGLVGLTHTDLAMIRFLVSQVPVESTLRSPLDELYARVVIECNRRHLQLDRAMSEMPKRKKKPKKKRKHK